MQLGKYKYRASANMDLPNMRPNWNQIFLEICEVIKNRSSCIRLQTAAIIVKDTNIISIGYNGVPKGQPHCSNFWKHFYKCAKGINKWPVDQEPSEFCDYVSGLEFSIDQIEQFNTFDEFIGSDVFYRLHHQYSLKNELHGEINALLQCDSSKHGATMYTLYSPCIQCAKSIVSAKIKKVYYNREYLRDQTGIQFLIKNKVVVEKI